MAYYTDFKVDTKKSKIETSLLIQNLLKVHGKVNGNVSKNIKYKRLNIYSFIFNIYECTNISTRYTSLEMQYQPKL